ncbi:hypothetical protein BCV72DRAFT_310112 [Rhizopus microsporus var. microsporus]|uniref:Cas12f1-like TNB domain-containing protein n=2 Tax=Rhizopus microsporus var. microsporus TaxID=86635 RepID=A0A1X0QNL2_RHIZD|nr:hypothetical protein BCV72DRAFT_310112 [Rhizopus microsporus var. microsporus]
MKGKRPAPINEGTEFVSVDEYLTSQICNKCKPRQLNNTSIAGSKRRVHSILKCESCGTVWNRDVNSVLNIYDLQKTNGVLGFNALSIAAMHSLTPR